MPNLGAEEPALFVGPMRSGKSNLMAWLLEDLSSVVIIDSKQKQDEWTSWGPRNGYLVTHDPAAISEHSLVIWQVDMPSLMDVPGWRKPGSPGYLWTDGLDRIMARRSTRVVFDELVHVLPAGHPHPSAVQILTQGAGFKIAAWGGSQYANRIETMIVRGAVHCFCFRHGPKDLKLMGDGRGADAAELAQLPDYAFGYHLASTSTWSTSAPVPRVMG